ncbi:dihydroflavonol-4-reductase-like [Dorcoceras hygrometricum]|uniref:Dihydroflavonol-4-reductase-like n=1 Tax=Dorcoceras hygrometricum TaxID=472368 RepID=A0A2Z7BJA6_9LAMI|nr:dihydroflavonol-4-reductase-like [Dorcoceras hygrometricum]
MPFVGDYGRSASYRSGGRQIGTDHLENSKKIDGTCLKERGVGREWFRGSRLMASPLSEDHRVVEECPKVEKSWSNHRVIVKHRALCVTVQRRVGRRLGGRRAAPAELSSSADCDDIIADVIIADSRSCASSQLLIVMTSLLMSS